jgi:cholesterol 7-dehydrogenase
MGIEGQVKQDNCIQCPFHGWSYSGETGACVGILSEIK